MFKTNKYPLKLKIVRFFWIISWGLISFIFPRAYFNFIKIIILKLFKAKITFNSVVHSSARIFMPWNLQLEEYSCIGPNVIILNVNKVIISRNVVISQGSYLCTASHNIYSIKHELISKPIFIKSDVWIASDAYIGPGVIIDQYAVIAARSCVIKNVSSYDIVGGNPAKFIKKRNFLN
jgi:putative colanic acid biosynthesis acetyltransferase WcaF